MCGIAAWFRYPSKVDETTVNTVMSIIFPRLMLEIEERGFDASGVYQVHQDGDWMLAKTGRKISEWLTLAAPNEENDPILFEDFARSWEEHPSPVGAVVGHCRKATAGTRGKQNKDNHPFSVQLDERNAILGVHNGTLSNHERIFERLKEMGSPLERQGEVDSESLFHLLFHASEGGVRPWTKEDLYSVARKVDGSYALVAMNSRFPQHVAVMRDDRPLEACVINPLGVLVLCSEKRFIERAVNAYNLIVRHALLPLPKITAEFQLVAERTCRIFDLSRPLPKVVKWGFLEDISELGNLNTSYHALPEKHRCRT